MPRYQKVLCEPLEPRLLLSGEGLLYEALPDVPIDLTLRLFDDAGTLTLQLVDRTGAVVASRPLAGTSWVQVLGSDLDDLLTVDFSDWFSIPVAFHGRLQSMGGKDALRVKGGGKKAASYIPDAVTPGSGEVIVDGTAVAYTGLEPVTISDMASLTFTTSGSADIVTVDSPAPGENRISGTSDGVAFEAVTFFNIPTVAIDTAANDSTAADDSVTIQNSLVAAQLQNLSISMGAGADMLALDTPDLTLPVPGGALALDAGMGLDTIRGPPAGAVWNIIENNRGTVEAVGSLAFTSVENLQGSAGADTFVFAPGGSLSGTLAGGQGTDTLVGADTANTWVLTGFGAGTLNGQAFVEIENLVGGAVNDAFVFAGGSVSGTIAGGGGNNTFDYSASVAAATVNLGAGTATGTGGIANLTHLVGSAGSDTLFGPETDTAWIIAGVDTGSAGAVAFAGIEDLRGGSKADTFVLTSSASVTGALVGGLGSDTLAGADRANDWQVTAVDAGTLNGLIFSGIEHLVGGALDDIFVFAMAGSVSGAIAGGPGIDRVRGADRRNRWVIAGAGTATLNGVVLYSVEQLQGGSLDDEFTFAYGDANLSGAGSDAASAFGLLAVSTVAQLNDVIDNQLADFLDPVLFPGGIPSTTFVLSLTDPVRISDLFELSTPTLMFRNLVFSSVTAWTGFVDLTAPAATMFPDDVGKRATIADAPATVDLTAAGTGVADDLFAVSGTINLKSGPRTSDLEQDRLFLDQFAIPVIDGKVDLDSSGAIDGDDDGTLGTRLGRVDVVDGLLVHDDGILPTFVGFGIVGGVFRLVAVASVAGSLDINEDGIVNTLDDGVIGGTIGAARGLENGLGWPGWIKVTPTFQKLFWNNFRLAADYPNPRLTMDATLDFMSTGSSPADALLANFFQFGGRVTGLVFDLQLRQAGKFPVVDITSASANIAVTLFGIVDVQGAFTLGLVKVDAGGNVTEIQSQVADRILYGAVRARAYIGSLPFQKAPAPNPADGTTPESDTKGFGFALGLSEFGPLQVFFESPLTHLIEPNTTLSIKNLHGGVSFGSTLPDITNPEDLRGPDFKPISDLTLAEWEARLREAVADQAKAAAELKLQGQAFAASWVRFTQPMRIEAGGTLVFQALGGSTKLAGLLSGDVDIIIDTGGRILIRGVLNALFVIKVPTWLYLNFSDVNVTNPETIAVTLLALFDFPQIPQGLTDAAGIKPLLTARGSLIFQPLKDGLPLDIDPVDVTAASRAPAAGGGFDVTYQIDPTRIGGFQTGTRIVVRHAVPEAYDGEFVLTGVDQVAPNTITLHVGATDPGAYVGGAKINLQNQEPNAFELALTGGVDFNIPFVTTISLDGNVTVTFTVNPPAGESPRIDLSFDAVLRETNVGNIGRAVGTLHLVFDVQDGVTAIAAGGSSETLTGIANQIGALQASTTPVSPAALVAATDPGLDVAPEITPQRPVLILPGIGGVFAVDAFRSQWFTQRGVAPANLQVDPLGQYYHDLIRTLRDVGYTLDQDLFVANYDWRMPPGPTDALLLDSNLANDTFDGVISGLTAGTDTATAESITDTDFLYGVDYLGFWLDVASDQWAANHSGARPSSVDIIAHSTGGVVARTYIQSAAYGGMTSEGYALPRVNDFIMVGVPNRGAAKAWNVLHDDWDIEAAFRIVLSKVVDEAFLRLTNPADPDYTGIITGPDYDILRNASIPDPNPSNINVIGPSAVDFISYYIPTGRGLLATYPFLDPDGSGLQPVQTVNDRTAGAGARNAFLLDLNAGLDRDFTLATLDASAGHTVLVGSDTRAPNAFIDLLLGTAVVIYGDGIETPIDAIQHTGPAMLVSGEPSGREILPFTNFIGRAPGAAEVWYEDVKRSEGDSTVPAVSAVGQFASDDAHLANGKLQIHRMTSADADPTRPTLLAGILLKGDNLDHTGLMSFTEVQREILKALGLVEGVDFRVGVLLAPNDVSFGLWNNPAESLLVAVSLGILDPEDLLQLLSELPFPKVELWGAATLDTNFAFLRRFGIFADGQGVLRLNSTDETKLEVLPQLTQFNLGATDVTVLPSGTRFAVTVTLPAGDAAQFGLNDLILVKNPDNRLFDGAFAISAVDTTAGTITYLMDSNPGVWRGTRGKLSPARQVELLPESFSLRVDGSLEFRIDFDGDGFNLSETNERVFLIAGAFAMQFSRQGFDVAVFRETTTGVGPATLQIGPSGTALLQFDVFGFLAIRVDTTFALPGGDGVNNSGFAASLAVGQNVTLPAALASVVNINGQFVVVINTTRQEASFTIPVGADSRASSEALTVAIPRGPPASVAAIDLAKLLTGDATAFGDPATLTAAAYVLVYLGGTNPAVNPNAVFTVGFFNLTGRFSFLAKFDTAFFLEIEGNFSLNISAGSTTLLSFTGQGFMRLDTGGLVAAINLGLSAGVPSSFGFTLTAALHLELNTGAARFRVHADGRLGLLGGTFELTGTFDLSVDATGVSLRTIATVGIFGFPLTANGMAVIKGAPNAGIVFSIGLTVGGSNTTTIAAVAGKINITGRFLLEVNTTGVTVNGVAPGLKVAVTDAAGTGPATVNVLGFVMTGGVTISITPGPAGATTPRFAISNLNLSLNFFNFVTFNVTGSLSSTGSFSLTAGFSIRVGNDDFGASGSVSATFSNTGFSASGSFSGRLFGFSVGPITGTFSITNNQVYLGIRVVISTPAVRVCAFGGCVTIIPAVNIDKTASFFIGTITPPETITPPPAAPPAPILARKIGTDLFLNIGVDAHLRGAASGTTGVTVEVFEVTHISGVRGTEMVAVSAFSVTQQFSGIARIVATDAGADDDAITIAAGVLANADLNGGDDDDELVYRGSGSAILRGGNGADRLTGGGGANTLEGGAGGDFLVGGSGTNVIRGGLGNDQIDVRAGSYDVFGDDGNDLVTWNIAQRGQLNSVNGGADLNDPANPFGDTIRIIGTSAAEVGTVTAVSPGFTVAYAGLTATAVNTEGLVVDARGGSDTLTINDPTGSALAQVALLLGNPDGAPDSVTLHGSPQADVFTLSIGQDEDGADFVAIDYSISVGIAQSHAASGDALAIRGGGGPDVIDAHQVSSFLVNLTLAGDDGADRIIGSPFADILEGGSGDDTISGGLGVDTFRPFAGLPETDFDTLVEELNVDYTLTDNTLTISSATVPAETEQLKDASGNKLFDLVVLRGGSAANAFVVRNWTGAAALDGKGGSDTYTIDLNGSGSSVITVNDSGTAGTDTLTVNGTAGDDRILMRASIVGLAFVAAIHGTPPATAERVNYNDTIEQLTVNAAGGNDFVALDDNRAATTVVGGAGQDRFQVGQLFRSRRDTASAGIAPADFFATIETTGGFLSAGVSFATVIQGGTEGDAFIVFRNTAPLTLRGEGGNDSFTIRAFLLAVGSGLTQYVVSAPITIVGGDGFDTQMVVGTEVGDDFVITDAGIFGIGRSVSYDSGVESVKVDGAEGNDRFFVLSTNANVVTEVSGGLGSDEFSIAGDAPPVVTGAVSTVFPPIPHVTNRIQGPLFIGGFDGAGSAVAYDPLMLPGETNVRDSLGFVQAAAPSAITVNSADLVGLPAGFFNDLRLVSVEITRGTGAGQTRQVSAQVADVGTGQVQFTIAGPWATIPDGTSQYALLRLHPNLLVDESTQQDVLTVFNEDDVTSLQQGTLTLARLTGLGMGGDRTIGGQLWPGGVTYLAQEVVEILLGEGVDEFAVLSVAAGAITAIHGNAGNDVFAITAPDTPGHLVVYGDTAASSRHDGSPGSDFIDAMGSSLGATLYGGAGRDTILGGTGDDLIFGGSGDDNMSGGPGNDILIGDSGVDVALRTRITTIRTAGMPGQDNFDAPGGDTLTGGPGNDIVVGDHGTITQVGGAQGVLVPNGVIRTIETANPTAGGIDVMRGDDGNDALLGGFGSDTMAGGAGEDVLAGDNARVFFTAAGIVDVLETTFPAMGHPDLIAGGAGHDVVLGGAAGDTIEGDLDGSTADGSDILIGDQGRIDFTSGVATRIETSNPAIGGLDTIRGQGGDDIILGGTGTSPSDPSGRIGDLLAGDAGADIVAGDNALVLRNSAGMLETVHTTVTDKGEDDNLEGGEQNDILLGGLGADTMRGGAGHDILLGDHGYISWVIDGNAATLDLVTTTDPLAGGRDLIRGDADNDIAFGGTAEDTMHGGSGNDLLFGDHGKVERDVTNVMSRIDQSQLPLTTSAPMPFTFTAIDTGAADRGADDMIHGNDGDDIILGQQGNDLLMGDGDHDDIMGGHNVPGGIDDLIGGTGPNDLIDGGGGFDTVAGDNARILRTGLAQNPRFRLLGPGGLMYRAFPGLLNNESPLYGTPNVTADPQADPEGAPGREVVLLNHDANTESATGPRVFGHDFVAGGADNDQLFGQLGRDVLQGDGSIDMTPAAAPWRTFPLAVPSIGGMVHFNVTEAASDGDDYMEGNGGPDLMFGNLGQDDMMGGSSTLFGLSTPAMRPDGSDEIYGGAGIRIARNEALTESNRGVIALANRHFEDADAIAGDNADIFRLVRSTAQGTAYLAFNYDRSNAFEPGRQAGIRPRAFNLRFDYTPAQGDTNGDGIVQGAADVVQGESGDDWVHGMTGDDVLFGGSEDDDIYGEHGNDWMTGGTGDDALLGDDGLISTSRNVLAGIGSLEPLSEPLYGVLKVDQVNQPVATPGHIQEAIINVLDHLKKTVDLTPFDLGGDDIMYGGAGNDALHGGAGNDAMSGAEALPESAGVKLVGTARTRIIFRYNDPTTLRNPGNILGPGALQPDEFLLYNEFVPRQKIVIDASGLAVAPGTAGAINFLLNFEAFSNPFNPAGSKIDDGNDALFGDLGHDWLVGGTGQDHAYGGRGADLLNLDDNLETNLGANDVSDEPTFSGTNDQLSIPSLGADIGYGGAGRDVLIANTGADRLIDWVGEFNAYLVPFATFGEFTTSRDTQPQLPKYLYALSASDGADPTRAVDTAGDPARNGEPNGELSLVLQKDPEWQVQTGAPADPQAGNIPGGKRDAIRASDFNSGTMAGFAADGGVWTVSGDALQITGVDASGDAVSVYHVNAYVPKYFEVLVSAKAMKPAGTMKSNAYVVLDYHTSTDFKFAGIDVTMSKLVLGRRTASGWVVDVQTNLPAKSDTFYSMLVAVNDTTVTVTVGKSSVSHTFAARVVDGKTYGLNWGMVGLGANQSLATFDNVKVQVLPPQITFVYYENFMDGVADRFTGPRAGNWQVTNVAFGGFYDGTPATGADIAFSTVDLGLAAGLATASYLELSAMISTQQGGGFIFDQSDTNFKFVAIVPALDAQTGSVVIGHHTDLQGWAVDAVTALSIQPGSFYVLRAALKGRTVAVSLNGQAVLSYGFNETVVDGFNETVVDGRFGLLSRSGTSTFDNVTVMTDDPTFQTTSTALLAAEPAPAGLAAGTALAETALVPIVAEAMRRWSGVLASATDSTAAREPIQWVIADLPQSTLGWVQGNTILIDADGAGYGWFVDLTPAGDSEFKRRVSDTEFLAAPGSDAYGRMDLLTVVMHELGHVLGFDHRAVSSHDLMEATLADGVRLLAAEASPSTAVPLLGHPVPAVRHSIQWGSAVHHVAGWRGPVWYGLTHQVFWLRFDESHYVTGSWDDPFAVWAFPLWMDGGKGQQS